MFHDYDKLKIIILNLKNIYSQKTSFNHILKRIINILSEVS